MTTEPELDEPDDDGPDYPQGLDPFNELKNAAYLVARGVRGMALVGECSMEAKGEGMQVLRMAASGAQAGGLATLIPFMVWKGDWYSCGFAREAWIIDTYKWACGPEVPVEQTQRIVGLLLGYSVEAIGHFARKAVVVG